MNFSAEQLGEILSLALGIEGDYVVGSPSPEDVMTMANEILEFFELTDQYDAVYVEDEGVAFVERSTRASTT